MKQHAAYVYVLQRSLRKEQLNAEPSRRIGDFAFVLFGQLHRPIDSSELWHAAWPLSAATLRRVIDSQIQASCGMQLGRCQPQHLKLDHNRDSCSKWVSRRFESISSCGMAV